MGLIKICRQGFILAALQFFTSSFVHAQGSFSGYLGVEVRLFASEPLFEEQEEHSQALSGFFEYYKDINDGQQQFVATGFARYDTADSERSKIDARELYWWGDFNHFQVFAGVRKVFWGVTESVHLVDVINQTDLVENINADEKLGQPLVQLLVERDWGTLEFFALPLFRERTFPGDDGRLRGQLVVSNDAIYQDNDEENHLDFAIRYSHYYDVWDFGFSHFSGTSREPGFIPVINADNQIAEIAPFYAQIEQTGIDIQATIGAWLWKLEAVSRYEKAFGRSSLAAGGFEYTFFAIGGGNSDLGIIAEYQFDDRIANRVSNTQNDLAFGARWALNDIDGSEFLFLVSKDLDQSNTFMSLEISRRLTDAWKLEAQVISFIDIEPGTNEFDLREDDHVQVELRRYF